MLAPLTPAAVFTAWRAAPGVLAAAAGLGGAYGWGLRRRRARAADRWPVGRAVVFFAGVATILLVGCSFLGVYDSHLVTLWITVVEMIGVGLPFILIVVNRMSREDTRRAAVVDAELDAAGPTGLWWESDPQLAERFRRR